MEAWQQEPQRAFVSGLGFKDEFENKFFLQMLVVVSNEFESEPQIGGSRIGRQFSYCNKEVNHERLYKDYFLQRSTCGSIKFWKRYRMRR